ncbi:MAG: RNA 2',3'-cyclic phosphodiesterase [Candidatus Cryosericum sp.]
MRAFVGIALSGDFAPWFQELTGALGPVARRVRLVPPASCHMTLRFLGEIPEDQTGEVASRLRGSVASLQVGSVSLERLGIFHRNGAASVLWAGPRLVSATLKELAGRVTTALAGLGSNAQEEQFEPHVTLGRFLSGTRYEDVVSLESVALRPFSSPIRRIVLYESLLGQGHPVYVVRATVSLAEFAE